MVFLLNLALFRYLEKSDDKKSIQLLQSTGNETGDSGPYAFTKYNTPNVEQIGSLSTIFLDQNNKNFDFDFGVNYESHTLTDWRIVKRTNKNYTQSNNSSVKEFYEFPANEKNSAFLSLDQKHGNASLFLNYSNSNKLFFFKKVLMKKYLLKI